MALRLDPLAPLAAGYFRVGRAGRPWRAARERARLNHLPSPWARFKRDLEYAARRWFYPDGTAHRTAWLYGYDVAAEAQYRAAEPTPAEAIVAQDHRAMSRKVL